MTQNYTSKPASFTLTKSLFFIGIGGLLLGNMRGEENVLVFWSLSLVMVIIIGINLGETVSGRNMLLILNRILIIFGVFYGILGIIGTFILAGLGEPVFIQQLQSIVLFSEFSNSIYILLGGVFLLGANQKVPRTLDQ